MIIKGEQGGQLAKENDRASRCLWDEPGGSSLPASPKGKDRHLLVQTVAASLCWGRRKEALGNA